MRHVTAETAKQIGMQPEFAMGYGAPQWPYAQFGICGMRNPAGQGQNHEPYQHAPPQYGGNAPPSSGYGYNQSNQQQAPQQSYRHGNDPPPQPSYQGEGYAPQNSQGPGSPYNHQPAAGAQGNAARHMLVATPMWRLLQLARLLGCL